MNGRIYPEEQFEHDFAHEPDQDDIRSLEQADEDDAPPPEPFYAFEDDEDIYDDEDVYEDEYDLCPDCGEGFDGCVCGDDDDTDWPLSDPKPGEEIHSFDTGLPPGFREDDGSGFDGLGLCPNCRDVETRGGELCLRCRNEQRDYNG